MSLNCDNKNMFINDREREIGIDIKGHTYSRIIESLFANSLDWIRWKKQKFKRNKINTLVDGNKTKNGNDCDTNDDVYDDEGIATKMDAHIHISFVDSICFTGKTWLNWTSFSCAIKFVVVVLVFLYLNLSRK